MKNTAKLASILREWWKSGQIILNPDNPTSPEYPIPPMIKDYMDRLFQVKKEADARLEKIIATAVVKFSMSKMGMSKEEALQAAREAVTFLRDVRAKKLLEEGKITPYGYEMYNRFIHSAWVKGAVKAAIKHTGKKVKVILETLIEKTPLRVLKPVIETVESLIPEEVKQKVKKKAKELLTKAAEELPKVVAPMIEEGYKVAKKVKEIVSTGIQKAVEKAQDIVEKHPVVKRVVEAIKIAIERIPVFGPLKEKLKNFG